MEINFVKVRDNSDATTDYIMLPKESFNVSKFLRDYVLKQKEYGSVAINDPRQVLLIFNHEEISDVDLNLLISVCKETVQEVKANGNWGLMNYLIII